MHTVKWFQVILCNINNSTSVICLHTVKWLNSSIWAIDGTLTDTTTSGQSGPGSNGNEGVLYIPQRTKTEPSPSDRLVLHPGHSLKGVLSTSAEMQLVHSTAPANWVFWLREYKWKREREKKKSWCRSLPTPL